MQLQNIKRNAKQTDEHNKSDIAAHTAWQISPEGQINIENIKL